MEPEYKSPNFLIIGAEKSGTTWLYNKLRQHPEIYLPLTKECHFFNKFNSNLDVRDNYNKLGWEWYGRFFNEIPEQVKAVGEATPMYLCDPVAPQRIAGDIPEVKLIYLLRNPIRRAYSHYWMAYRKGDIDESFEEIVAEKDPRFIERGRYARQLTNFYRLFPKENLKGYIFEYFFENPEEGLKDIFKFLGVEVQNFPFKDNRQKVHASSKPRSKILNKVISKAAKKLRKNSFTFGLLDWFKSTGIAPTIKDWNNYPEVYPPLSKSLFYELFEYYEEDIEMLEKQERFKLDVWKEY